MRVSYLKDSEIREEYLLLLTRIDNKLDTLFNSKLDRKNWWKDLGYEESEIPEF